MYYIKFVFLALLFLSLQACKSMKDTNFGGSIEYRFDMSTKKSKSPPKIPKNEDLQKIKQASIKEKKYKKQSQALKTTKCGSKNFNIALLEASTAKELLENLAKNCAFNIILKDEYAKKKLEERISNLNISQMKLEEILKLLIEERDLSFEFENSVLKIKGLYTKSFKIPYISSISEGQNIVRASVEAIPKQAEDSSLAVNNDDNLIKSSSKFDFWTVILKDIKALLNNGVDSYKAKDPIINQNAGLITITASKNQINRIKKYLKHLVKNIRKQVIVDVKIISVKLNKANQKGINWDNFSLSFNTLSNNKNSKLSYQDNALNQGVVRDIAINNELNFSSVLNFLNKSGKTQVLSSPKIVVLNNQQALISVGDTINYQTKESSKGTETGATVTETFNNYSIFIGILLNILPAISDDGKVILRISPLLSDFKYPEDRLRQVKVRNIAPDIVQKKLSTVVELKDGESLILGGLISKSTQKDNSSVNYLSLIPILGWFFMGERFSEGLNEIVFIIKPSIARQNLSAKELGYINYEAF